MKDPKEEREKFQNDCNESFLRYIKKINIEDKLIEQLKKDEKNDEYTYAIRDSFFFMTNIPGDCWDYFKRNPKKFIPFVTNNSQFELSYFYRKGRFNPISNKYYFVFKIKK